MPNSIFSLLGMLLAVVLVLLLAFIFTKYVAGRGLMGLPRGQTGGKLRVLDQMPLGKEQRLAVVQMGERCFLVGIAPSGITLLTELTEEERAQWQAGGDDGGQQPPSFREAFAETLRKRMGKK